VESKRLKVKVAARLINAFFVAFLKESLAFQVLILNALLVKKDPLILIPAHLICVVLSGNALLIDDVAL
jgi:hypothetical protein